MLAQWLLAQSTGMPLILRLQRNQWPLRLFQRLPPLPAISRVPRLAALFVAFGTFLTG